MTGAVNDKVKAEAGRGVVLRGITPGAPTSERPCHGEVASFQRSRLVTPTGIFRARQSSSVSLQFSHEPLGGLEVGLQDRTRTGHHLCELRISCLPCQ